MTHPFLEGAAFRDPLKVWISAHELRVGDRITIDGVTGDIVKLHSVGGGKYLFVDFGPGRTSFLLEPTRQVETVLEDGGR